MKKNKESYYMIIPSEVWNSDLDDKSMLLYGHISVLANKDGYCYANNKYFERVLDCSLSSLKRYLNNLESKGFIKRQVIYKDGIVQERKIYMNQAGFMGEPGPRFTDDPGAGFTNGQDNNTSNNNTSNNTIDDTRKKLFFKLVELYPKNRIGNRQHGLKKWLHLKDNDMKLAITNLDRYLKLSGDYVKSLQNYITEECYTEEWLCAEEKTKQKKTSKINTNHNFSGKY